MGRPIEGAKPKVLVVDDEPRMRSLLALHLRQSFDVETVASGEEALARIRARTLRRCASRYFNAGYGR